MNARAAARRGSALWLQGLVCGAVLAVVPAAAVLAVALLAPAGIAAALDRTCGRRLTRAVLLAIMPFTLDPFWRLWTGGMQWQSAVELLETPTVLLPAWLAATLAWSACELLPGLFRAWADWRATEEAQALRGEIEELRREWDV